MKVIASSPARISLLGSGTDVAPYRDLYGGEVLSLAINIRTSILLYSDDEIWEKVNHSIPFEANPALLYEILDHFHLTGTKHVRIESSFGGFISAGLGSSASFTVALIAAIAKYKGLVGLRREDIADLAYEIEVNELGWAGGKQDQFAAAMGGLNHFEFAGEKTTIATLQRKYAEQLASWMVLCYIGKRKESRKIQKGLETLTDTKRQALHNIKKMVPYVTACLMAEDYSELGTIIHESWELKKTTNDVSTPDIDQLYDYARKHGATGGKILGAGQGGYMVFIVSPEKRRYFVDKMLERGVEDVDFSPDYNGVEARIL